MAGTPIICLKNTVMGQEFVLHKKNGFLLSSVSEKEILKFEKWIFSKNIKRDFVSTTVKQYSNVHVTKKWNKLFKLF